MNQDDPAAPVEGGLTVTLDGAVRRRLPPGGPARRPLDPVLTFGRARESDTHLHVGPSGGHADPAISRFAGAIHWWAGQWTVRNTSETRPFVVVVRGHRIAIPPLNGQRAGQWAIGPEGVLVELPRPTGPHEIGLIPVAPAGADGPWLPDGSGPSTSPPFAEPTAHERRQLAAKFLSRRRPGAAVGDECAADRANQAPGAGAAVTAKAVEDAVGRWRRRLEGLGHPDVAGRGNVDRVGELLLAYRVITEADRLDLPPVDDGDPRA